jgi:hypothetical protein
LKIRVLAPDGYKIVDLTRKKAIRERCLNCSAWSVSEVRYCVFEDCPLYPYRMGESVKHGADARAKVINAYCQWCINGNSHDVRECPAQHCPLFPYRMGWATDRSMEISDEDLQKGSVANF